MLVPILARHGLIPYALDWIPPLRRVVVSDGERRQLTDFLDLACQTVAMRPGLDSGRVRSNIFVPDETGRLHIPEGLTHNMSDSVERAVVMDPSR